MAFAYKDLESLVLINYDGESPIQQRSWIQTQYNCNVFKSGTQNIL
ncbi:hypothetical protein CCACVL1_02184 [Corchorus capsularis]|uniref:Uncharacterized protein n=1 Tax=Corchorus capsularis TaxID=210143 RepID=A0A1R3KAU3_COCAP|nr:hypothetical protein CCACVL1_02184 [Corchorus capsularis]